MNRKWTPSDLKEVILAVQVLIWGFCFMLPGNVFDTTGRYHLDAVYAQDWFWGIFLLIAGFILLFFPRDAALRIRRYTHAFCWLFWFSISVLVISRTFVDGVVPTDILIVTPYIVTALVHLTLYIRLAGTK